jgi:hypothetical protein
MASANVAIVKMSDGREVCLSYGVPVAAFIPRYCGYVRTARRYSKTTSTHANAFAGKDSPLLDDAAFRALVPELTGGRS